MHLVYVTRLYSGLYDSIATGVWNPTGIPAVARVVPALAEAHDLIWIIACRNEKESAVVGSRFTRRDFGRLRVHVLPFRRICRSGKVNGLFNDLACVAHLLRLRRGVARPIYYCDRASVVVGGIMKRVFGAPSAIRILGVISDQKLLASRWKYKLLSPLTWRMFKTCFDLAVCTQDGSGGEYFRHLLLNPRTPCRVLLNGVDLPDTAPPLPAGEKLAILFVGRLSEDKGILELLDAVGRLRLTHPAFHLTVVGDGHLRSAVEARIAELDLGAHVTLAGAVPLDAVQDHHRRADVYVSLNTFGNLSNTVLEAMAAARCCVILGRDEATHTDFFTEEAVPDDTVVRIGREDIVGNLTTRLGELVADRTLVAARAARMDVFRRTFLDTWENRARLEIALLEQVAAGAAEARQG